MVCSGDCELVPLDLKQRRRGSGVEEIVEANSLSDKLMQPLGVSRCFFLTFLDGNW